MYIIESCSPGKDTSGNNSYVKTVTLKKFNEIQTHCSLMATVGRQQNIRASQGSPRFLWITCQSIWTFNQSVARHWKYWQLRPLCEDFTLNYNNDALVQSASYLFIMWETHDAINETEHRLMQLVFCLCSIKCCTQFVGIINELSWVPMALYLVVIVHSHL